MNAKYGQSPQILQQFLEVSRQYLTAPTIDQARPQPTRRAHALTRRAASLEANHRHAIQGTAPTYTLR